MVDHFIQLEHKCRSGCIQDQIKAVGRPKDSAAARDEHSERCKEPQEQKQVKAAALNARDASQRAVYC